LPELVRLQNIVGVTVLHTLPSRKGWRGLNIGYFPSL